MRAAGIETKIWDSLSLKAEYRYIDLGGARMTLLPNELPEINETLSTKFDPTFRPGRVSLNYRFGGSAETTTAPLVAGTGGRAKPRREGSPLAA